MVGAEPLRALKDPLIGQVVQGRYQICRAIGKGGMGVVYEAQHLLIGRKVALKTLAAHASVSPACVQRFRREAQAAASVGNSHVVDVLDMGQLDGGSFFIVLEHLDGVDLAFAVAQERRFSIARAIHVLCQLCDALSAVHAAGIIHRDLKPENIFLIARDGEPDFVKVLDFGVCKFNDADGGRLTVSGDRVGTPLFMAPEQVEGRSTIDHRTDIYALGAVLYFVLTGRAPFMAGLPQLFLKICNDPAPSVRNLDVSLPAELDEVVQRALSKEPKDRFASCGAFKAALLASVTNPDDADGKVADPTAARSSGNRDSGRSTASLVRALRLGRSRALGVRAIGIGALIISAVVGSYYLVRTHRVEPPPPKSVAPVSAMTTEVAFPDPDFPTTPLRTAATSPTVARSSAPASPKRHESPATSSVSRTTPAVATVADIPNAPLSPSQVPTTAVPRVESSGALPTERPPTAGKEVDEPHLNREPKRGL